MPDFSPMMKQYLEIKNKYKNEIVFFRLGDFYEMFYDDAELVSRELDLTLTGRNCGGEEKAPMCGVPHHSCESYIARLIEKGYKIVMCEQLEEANGRTIVKREVTRVITPGTILCDNILDEAKNNFLCVCFFVKFSAGVCFCDISTGELKFTQFVGKNFVKKIENEITLLSPKEILISGDFEESFKDFVYKRCSASVRNANVDFKKNEENIVNFLKEKIDEKNYKLFDPTLICAENLNENSYIITRCVGVLIAYLGETQKNGVELIKDLEIYEGSKFMSLECGAITNLELFETIRMKQKRGSLIWILEKTKTAMGKRLLRSWLEKPLKNISEINMRLDGVEELSSNIFLIDELVGLLSKIGDVQRLLSKISFGSVSCRDLKSLNFAISRFPAIKSALEGVQSKILIDILEDIDEMRDIFTLIDSAIVEEPPILTKDGGFIKKGFNKNLDEILLDMEKYENIANEIEKRERNRTKIPKLKIGFNRIFGYYIEVSQSYKRLVPDDYVRKQTLSGKERYVTEELKLIEARIFNAKDRIVKLENEILKDIKMKVCEQSKRISRTAQALALLDVIRSFAQVSLDNFFVRPIICDEDILDLRDSRHPVVERLLGNGQTFVPNDVYFDNLEKAIVITGPNMAGKSTYMRQIALNVIIAQIGCFVPARKAKIGIIDSIFTRIGASDDVAAGQSTFMVEMSEVAHIAENAGPKSLILLDEIGRGTSTFDGLSIARAVLEFVVKKIRSKTLFSTHYHEIAKNSIKSVRNFSIMVKKEGENIIFLYKIIPGTSDDSYGIEVAKLAGVPDDITSRAREILSEIDKKEVVIKDSKVPFELYEKERNVIKRLKQIDVNSINPVQCMNILFDLFHMI
ncbi:MAG: DNA mismatch repair protein MutS [Firmicutes bacterium]|nr:DNA mismatch repair protein MutS [Bacillota bacterium]